MPTCRSEVPLILVVNDDGIVSPGLHAAARAVLPLGEVLVVAPARQWSGAGRSMPHHPNPHTARYPLEIDGRSIAAYQVDTSPALTVVRAVLELVPRQPALLVSGINYGENVGNGITTSGTVGAALQGAAFGIPALAVSFQTPLDTHYNPSETVDFTTAAHFTQMFAQRMLQVRLPFDVDVLKIDVPSDATTNTPWRLTRTSRHTYFVARQQPLPSPWELTSPSPVDDAQNSRDYEPLRHPERTEPDSDIYALAVDRVVSVAPISLDMTSRVDRVEVESLLRRGDTLTE